MGLSVSEELTLASSEARPREAERASPPKLCNHEGIEHLLGQQDKHFIICSKAR